MKISSLIISIFWLTSLFGQNKNTYKFIEPNISISYDSSIYEIENRYSNSFIEINKYDFKLKDTSKKIKINVKAGIAYPDKINMSDLKKTITNRLFRIKISSQAQKEIINYDEKVRTVKSFLCMGAVGYVTESKIYLTSITCNHTSENDNTEVNFIFENSTNLDSCYLQVKDFLSGIKFYTKRQFEREESYIKSNYIIDYKILPYKDTTNFLTGEKITRLIEFKNKLDNPIVMNEVIYNDTDDGSYYVFNNSEKMKKITLESYSKQKGKVAFSGSFVFLNSFGKRVKIPFSFDYQND